MSYEDKQGQIQERRDQLTNAELPKPPASEHLYLGYSRGDPSFTNRRLNPRDANHNFNLIHSALVVQKDKLVIWMGNVGGMVGYL